MEQPAAQDPLIGLTIGNYQIKSKLGEGGMGSVYLAVHPLIGKQVALKVLHAEFASNRDVVARFFTEAKSVNDIQHPNIVDIVDYGELHTAENGEMVYFIMEFLDGESLSNIIRTQAPLPPERALAICMQIADALGASHQSGVVHRDLKPDNVILIQRGRQSDFVKVLDFGIAKLTGDQPGSRRTRTGIVMGTPAYMSPEQCEGRGNVDHRTDIYALGILLYEMITGRVPFTGEGYGEVLVKHLTQSPTRPSTIRAVSPYVEAVCLKALEKSPDNRYPTMEEFMKALADPVGYVESHGGLQAFQSAHLVDTGGPVPTVPNPTPRPFTPMTPAPGSIAPLTPAPGQLSPVPGTVPTPYPGMMQQQPKSRFGLIIGVVVAVLAIGGGAVFLLKGGGGDKSADQSAAPPIADGTGTDQAGDQGQTPDTPTADGTGATPDNANAATNGTTGTGAETKPVKPEVTMPPEPETVTIKVASDPVGAQVWLAGEDKARGQTPLSFSLEKADKKISVVIKKKGFKDRKTSIKPSRDVSIYVAMRPERRSSSSRRHGSRHSSSSHSSSSTTSSTKKHGTVTDKDGVISPF